MSFLLGLYWLRLPGILDAAGSQTLSYIDDLIIAGDEGKLTSLKGGF
jgi:hypothetical protein